MTDFYTPIFISDASASREDVAWSVTSQMIAADLNRGKYKDDYKLLKPEIVAQIANETGLNVVCALISWRLTSSDFANLHIYVKDNPECYYQITYPICAFEDNVHGGNIERCDWFWMDLSSMQCYFPSPNPSHGWGKGAFAFSADELKNMQTSPAHKELGTVVKDDAISVATLLENIEMWAEKSGFKAELISAHDEYRHANIDDITE